MSGSPTNVNLNDTVPVSKPDAFNVEWQAGPAYPDPNSPGDWVRDTSACYRTPSVGGVVVLTADYQLSDVDSGWTFVCNSSSAITLTMPIAIPILPNPEGVWNIRIENKGAGVVTVDPNGLNLDGSSSTQTIGKGRGFSISTDGTNYWSSGLSAPTKARIAIPSTTRGDFSLAHGLGVTPSDARINITADGLIRFQASPSPPWDATNAYLNASDDGLTGFLVIEL